MIHSPSDAIARGIGMVHQHFQLADNLTVLENVVLGDEPTRRGWLDFGAARRKIMEISDAYGLDVDPDALVEELGVGDRQRVEILKVLYRGARTLILDEPTAVLVPQEVDELFGALRGLKEQGMAIIFISHKLDEVLKVADEITVIRRGTTVASVLPGDVTSRQLAELMVGSELPSPETRESTVTDRPLLTVQGLGLTHADGRPLLSDISFTIHAGEVLGIAGVEGNGQAELVETLLGMRTRLSRDSLPRQQRTSPAGPPAGGARAASPTSRRTERGTDCCSTPPCGRTGCSGTRPCPRTPEGHSWTCAAPRRTPNGSSTPMTCARRRSTSSPRRCRAGNQQKLIVGREMSADPVVLVAAHPTRGVDVGAQAAIWDLIREARGNGLAVLAHLGRPRRAHRPVGHAYGHAPWRPWWLTWTRQPSHRRTSEPR